MKIGFHPEALKDVSDTTVFYVDRSGALGQAFLSDVETTLETLVRNPRIGKEVHVDVRAFPLRRFPYWIYYLLDGETLVVVAVSHEKRLPNHWIDRL